MLLDNLFMEVRGPCGFAMQLSGPSPTSRTERLTSVSSYLASSCPPAVKQLLPTLGAACLQAPAGPALSGHGSGSGGIAQTHSGSSGNSGGGGGHAAASAAPMQETVHDSAAEKAARVKEKNRCLLYCAWTCRLAGPWGVRQPTHASSLCIGSPVCEHS